MNEKIKNIDFQKVDWSKYQNQIDNIYQTYEELKKDKKLIRLLKKIRKTNSHKIQYNLENQSQFKLISNSEIFVSKKSSSLDNCKQILPFS